MFSRCCAGTASWSSVRFLLVDAILALEPGRSIEATKTIPAHEDVFLDHFPGFPVVPGVLLTEMMAQAAGKCLDADRSRPAKAMLAKILSATFREWVRPDQTARIRATILQNRPAFARAECSVEVDGRMVCAAELFFAFTPMEQFAPGYRDEVLERWLADPARRG